MSDDPKTNEGAIPPRFSLKPTGAVNDGSTPAVTPEEAKKLTTRVEIPPTAQDSPPTLKKKTSRIRLEQVTAETGAVPASQVPGVGVSSKTIRLAPPSPTPPSLSIPLPSLTNTKTMTRNLATADDGKRQTSRISLESVLGERPTGEIQGTGTGPKTIRIKRPSQIQTIKPAAGTPEVEVTPAVPAAVSAVKSSTSRLELAEDMPQADGQLTQRKTIKIRRAEGGAAAPRAIPHSMAVARIEAGMAEQAAEQAAEQHAVHVLFPIAAAVALLILGVMVYILLAQAFPNPSLSYPGRITL
jgi:hypothetical protein